MKKKLFWIILIITFIIGIFVILNFIQKKRDARPFNIYNFPETISIINGTKYEKADTIIFVLANKIFHLDTLDLIIYYIPDIINSGEMEYYAIVQHLLFGHNKYLILLNKNLSLSKLKISLSHEFVHINQYQSGDLRFYATYAIYKGDSILFKDVKYEDRSFEKEAFFNQGKITKKLNKFLYE